MSARANRVAIVGPSHVLGSDLKDRLAEAGYPGDAVELLDLEEQVGLLTEYGDEARVVLEAAEESLRSFELVCFCGDPQTTARFAPAAAESETAIDCTGSLAGQSGAQLMGLDGAPEAQGLLALPHPAALLLAQLGSAIELAGATATLVLPASDVSDAGTEEMAQQAAALLNFNEMNDDVFGRRLAFDIWPDATRPDGVGARVRGELAELGFTPPAVQAYRGSIFHCVAASVFLPGQSVDVVTAALGEFAIGATDDGGNTIDSPARVAGLDGIHVGKISEDAGGTWVWAIVDNHRAITGLALTAIDARLGRPATR